jgi:hypothetical protein
MNTTAKSALRKYFLPGTAGLFLLLIALLTYYMRALGKKNDALVEAVLHHDIEHVSSLLHAGVSPDLQISFDAHDRPYAWAPVEDWGLRKSLGPPIRNTPLIVAAGQGDDQMVRLLLSNGANINARAHFSHQTALLAAIHAKRRTTTEILLQNRADPMLQDYNGYDAIAQAIQNNDPDVLKTVLEYCPNASLTKRYNGMTAMEWAVKVRNREIIKTLDNYALQEGNR